MSLKDAASGQVVGVLLLQARLEWFSTQGEKLNHLSPERCCHVL